MIFASAVVDVIGVASILPFVAVLSNPEVIHSNVVLQKYYSYFEFQSIGDFQFNFGILIFFVLMASLAIKAVTAYFQLRYSMLLESELSQRLVRRYLCQNYDWFLERHTAEIIKTVLSEVEVVVTSGVMQLLIFVTQSVVLVAILGLLLVVQPAIAGSVIIVIGTCYYIIFAVSRRRLSRLGDLRVRANEQRYKAAVEIFSAVKQIKTAGLERVYLNSYRAPARDYALARAHFSMTNTIPRFALEAVAFGGLILLVLSLMSSQGNISSIVPMVALYAFSGYRLLPAMQSIYASATQFRFVRPSLDFIYGEFRRLKEDPCLSPPVVSRFDRFRKIELINVSYRYPAAERDSLGNVSLTITAGQRIGIVGGTGGGKSTLVDMIIGLLWPKSGEIRVNGEALNSDNFREWQKLIGYVPQSVYLSEESIAKNIAFGVDDKDIDMSLVRRVSEMASLHQFVTSRLPEAYETRVGERGVRLSGGERQRIGIARALYRQPKLLVLDEATSALDNITEAEVMNAINDIGSDTTVIIIAHRLSTVKSCDRLYVVAEGRIIREGSYSELQQSSVFSAFLTAPK